MRLFFQVKDDNTLTWVGFGGENVEKWTDVYLEVKPDLRCIGSGLGSFQRARK